MVSQEISVTRLVDFLGLLAERDEVFSILVINSRSCPGGKNELALWPRGLLRPNAEWFARAVVDQFVHTVRWDGQTDPIVSLQGIGVPRKSRRDGVPVERLLADIHLIESEVSERLEAGDGGSIRVLTYPTSVILSVWSELEQRMVARRPHALAAALEANA